MTYRVVIDELVFDKDFKKIDPADRKRIIKAIRQKLTSKPKEFGQPLRGDLKGYRKLRVGEYRVIYMIEDERALVYVVLIGFRRNMEVYRTSLPRKS